MAGSRARVDERVARDRDEFPRVAAVVERELEHARRRVVPHFAVLGDGTEREVPQAARADDDLANAVGRVGDAIGGLRREPLVVAAVGVDHELHARGVQVVPHGLQGAADGAYAGKEAREVPVGELALGGARREVVLEPHLLGGAGAHVEVAVQHDDMPGAQVVAVVTLVLLSRGPAEVVEVARGVLGVVFDVARGRPGARFLRPPGGVIAVLVIRARPVGGGVVAGREHGAGNPPKQLRRLLVAGARARRDVAGTDEYCCCAWRQRQFRRWGRDVGRLGIRVLAAGREHGDGSQEEQPGRVEAVRSGHRNTPRHLRESTGPPSLEQEVCSGWSVAN